MSEAKVGLANPYALAELAVGRRVRWSSVVDREAFVTKVLGASVDELCAPVTGNLLASGAVETQRALASIRDAPEDRGEALRSYAEGGPTEAMLSKLSPSARARVISALAGGEQKRGEPGFTPAGAEWADPGDYYEEAAEYFDPVQGGLGDCYFIAALSAVAWSRPEVIVHRVRTTGPRQPEFVDRIEFNSAGTSIEVSERMPVITGTHAWIYARSSEPGEIWPAVYEKAYASGRRTIPLTSPTTGRSRGDGRLSPPPSLPAYRGSPKRALQL